MKIDVITSQPLFNSDHEIVVKLVATNGVKGVLKIDLRHLIQFANASSILATDFFVLAACVYGVDRLIKRRKNSVDGWSRDVKVTFPVSRPALWRQQKAEIEEVLSFLTGDYWEVAFVKSELSLPPADLDKFFQGEYSQINLFSGGLDSLIGAIDILSTSPEQPVFFVSHYDPEMHGPKGDQSKLIEKLESFYGGKFSHLPSTKIFLDESNDTKETTVRSRSIIFIGIALLVADAKSAPIVVPENGTVSLNYPLSPSRRSACSTRTTHPTLLSGIRGIWRTLGLQSEIVNPYEFKTKGEMVSECRNSHLLKKVVTISNSCGKRGHRAHWSNPSATHCGVCMPCIYRRAALASVTDNTTYGSELNSLFPFLTKKGQDAGACLEFLQKTLNKKEIKQELLINGLKDLEKSNKYVNVVERTRIELKKWVQEVGNSNVKQRTGL